ncbi:energy transducer TonB [Sphingomonas koreensis]|nr:energy transducer TonB [Sphingomonas koreensis]
MLPGKRGSNEPRGVIVQFSSRKLFVGLGVALVATAPSSGVAQVKSPAKKHTAAAAAPAVPQATPNGNPADWFPADAYPPQAKAAGVEGRTAFSISVDAMGRVTGCNITTSSGSPLLDSTTCTLIVTNARFKPAHDAAGQAVAGVWTSAMVWRLTAAAPELPEGIADQGGVSPAEAYNQSLTEEKQAEAAQSDPDQGSDQSPSPGDQ